MKCATQGKSQVKRQVRVLALAQTLSASMYMYVCVCTDVQTPYKQDKSKASITFSFSRNLLWHFCPIANTLEWLIAVCSHFAK